MAADDFRRELLSSDNFAQYSLRATFFVNRLRKLRLWEAIREVHQLTKISNNFGWNNREATGIDAEAWRIVQAKCLDPLLIFCHPRVLTEQPRLLLYYRTVALISQKGLGSLVRGNVALIERGETERLDPRWVHNVTVALNSIISVMLKTAADIEERDLPGFQFASAGASIQGAWNNAVGAAGETAAKTILVNHLKDEIVQVVWRDSTTTDYCADKHAFIIENVSDIRVVRMRGGYHLLFSSEPDISLRGPNDMPLIAIEVKAGSDPAGALERLGAAMKSFENDRNLNPRVKTVYVVRSITAELRKRIVENNPFDHTFGLSDLLGDDRTQRTFANLVLRVMLGKSR